MKSLNILCYMVLVYLSIAAVSLNIDLGAEDERYSLENDIKTFYQLEVKENFSIRRRRSIFGFFKKAFDTVTNYVRIGSTKAKQIIGGAQRGLEKAEEYIKTGQEVVDSVGTLLSVFTGGKTDKFMGKIKEGVQKADDVVQSTKSIVDSADDILGIISGDKRGKSDVAEVLSDDKPGNTDVAEVKNKIIKKNGHNNKNSENGRNNKNSEKKPEEEKWVKGLEIGANIAGRVLGSFVGGFLDKGTAILHAATGAVKAVGVAAQQIGNAFKAVAEGFATVIDAIGGIFGSSKKQHEEVVQKLDRNYEAIQETQDQIRNLDKKIDYLGQAMVKGFEATLQQIDGVSKKVDHVSQQVEAVSKQITESTTQIRNDIQDLRAEMLKEFNRLHQVLDGVSNQIKDVSIQMSQSTQQIRGDIQNLNKDMIKEFNKLHETLEELHVSDKISSLNTFMDYYWQHVKKNEMMNIDRVMDLERKGGIIEVLQDAVQPSGVLHGNLYHILNQNLANPKNFYETSSFKTLNILYLGVQTYVSQLFYLQEQYSFLANYFYFDKGDLEEYNNYIDYMRSNFNYSKSTLSGNNGLINQVISLIEEISKIPQVRANYYINNRLSEELGALKQSEFMVQKAMLAIISDLPQQTNFNIDFKRQPLIRTPIGNWEDGKRVRYAVQYIRNGNYSKIGPWSKPYTVKKFACPELNIQPVKEKTTRLIFRKFDNEVSQLVGVLENVKQKKFRDIDRDLYNAAGDYDEELSLTYCKTLIASGANLSTTFENGRMTLHAAAEAGNKELAENCLLSDQFTNINIKDNNGFTPLHIAVANERVEFVEMLIEKNVDLTLKIDISGLTALHIASSIGSESIIELLLNSNLTEINAIDKNGFTPLHSAVFGSFGIVSAVNILLSNNEINVNAMSSEGLTPLHLSVIENHPKIVEALLNCKEIDVNAKSTGSYTALHYAALTENLRILKILLAFDGIDINAADMNKWTALHFAVSNGAESMLNELLNVANIDLNHKTIDGMTPLHLAANYSYILETLLKYGAEVNAQTYEGITALHIAANIGNFESVQILVKYGANMELQGEFELLDDEGQYLINWLYMKTDSTEGDTLHIENCVKQQSIKIDGMTVLLLAAASEFTTSAMLSYLIRKGANTNAKSNDGRSFEMFAAQHGSVESIKYIIDTYHVKKLRDKHLNSLLHFAVKGHNMKVITFLIEESNLDINDKNRRGDTPLHIASLNGDLDVVKYLLYKNASVAVESNSKSTPLHYAASCASLQTIIYLVSHGANVTVKNLYSQLPLHKAALSGNFEVVKYFVHEKQLNYKELDINERNCLLYSIIWSKKEFVSYLVQYDPSIKNQILTKQYDNVPRIACQSADIDIIKLLEPKCNNNDESEENLLHLAAQQCFFDLLYYCLHRKVDINKGNTKKMSTPLHLVAQYCNSSFIKFLVQKGADINIKDNEGQTPLHYATTSENVEILLEYGANINMPDNSESTPIFKAVERGDLESVKFFQKNGADIHGKNINGDTSLHIAVKYDHIEIVSYLIEQGVDVNVSNRDLNGPLHYAAIYNSYINIAELLVEANTNVNQRNHLGATPLHYSISPILAKYLIEEAGTDPNIKNKNGEKLKIDIEDIAKALYRY